MGNHPRKADGRPGPWPGRCLRRALLDGLGLSGAGSRPSPGRSGRLQYLHPPGVTRRRCPRAPGSGPRGHSQAFMWTVRYPLPAGRFTAPAWGLHDPRESVRARTDWAISTESAVRGYLDVPRRGAHTQNHCSHDRFFVPHGGAHWNELQVEAAVLAPRDHGRTVQDRMRPGQEEASYPIAAVATIIKPGCDAGMTR